MVTLQVFDPALCCSTGICGVDVDQSLVAFAADVDWLKSKGVTVERRNLAQQPQAFADNTTMRQLLQTQGGKALPAVLVDSDLKSSGRYPSRDELARWTGIAETGSVFSEQVAELVAIGAAIASNCEACFRYHYDKARGFGVSDADVQRAVDLAQQVKDAPARAVLNLARRTLGHNDALSSLGVAVVPQSGGACCAPASPATATKCC